MEVGEKRVHITGFHPGSFPEGFCGYYTKEQNGTLYVGFRFSAMFGFFETGDFDATIPVEGEITEVIAISPNDKLGGARNLFHQLLCYADDGCIHKYGNWRNR